MAKQAPAMITIKTTKGDDVVDAIVIGNWAVHGARFVVRRKQWTITYVPSGYAIPEFYTEDLNKTTALRCAKALAEKFPSIKIANKKTGAKIAELLWRVQLGRKP